MIDKIDINFDSIHPKIGDRHISISTVLSHLNEPFDSATMAEKMYAKYYNDETSKYYNKEVQDILDEWTHKADVAKEYGRKLDDYVDKIMTTDDNMVYEHKIANGYTTDEHYQLICDGFNRLKTTWLDVNNIDFIDREKTLYLNTSNGWIKGRLDFFGYNNKTHKFVIIDWKTSAFIETISKYGKHLLGPCEHLDACNGNTYSIQTTFYKHALLENYLPKDTDPDDIEVYICQVPGKTIFGEAMYAVYPVQIPYEPALLYKIYDYAWSEELKLENSNIITHKEKYEGN